MKDIGSFNEHISLHLEQEERTEGYVGGGGGGVSIWQSVRLLSHVHHYKEWDTETVLPGS